MDGIQAEVIVVGGVLPSRGHEVEDTVELGAYEYFTRGRESCVCLLVCWCINMQCC